MKKSILIITFLIGLVSSSQTNIWDENPNTSQVEMDSLLTILPNSVGEERMPVLNRVAEIYWLINPDKTIEYASEALQLSKEYNNKNQEGLALINLCQGYLFNDLYDKALEVGLRSLEVRKEIGNDYDLAFTLRTLGWLYYDIGYYDKALDYHKEVLQIHEKIKDKQRIAYSFNSLGLIHAKREDFNLALAFFRKSLNLKKPFNHKDRISETMKNMGVCYRKTGDLVSAEDFLESSLRTANEIRDEQRKIEILNELSIVHLELKNYDKCYSLLNEARLLLERIKDNKEWIAENSRIRSKYYAEIGNFKEALNYYIEYDKAERDIFSNYKGQKLAEMRILFEAERRESEIKLLEQERNLESEKRRRVLLVSTLLVIIGVLIIVTLWININRKKAIIKQKERLSKERLKTQALVRENLEHKLDFRMKELTNLALFISQRTSIYKDLAKSFQGLEFDDLDKLKKDINSLIKEYSYKFNLNEDIQKFHANVETLQSEFLFRIMKRFPNLTEKEVQLAVQVKMKLSSKEIANLNNISTNSVEIGRHRLRKKLNLDSKESLSGFLEKI